MRKRQHLQVTRPLRQRGFTLMELMVVVSLIGVAMALAIPNFRDFIRNSRITSAANGLLSGLAIARSEAIKRQTNVGICATSDPNATPPVCSGAWAQGSSSAWVVWVDANDNWIPDNIASEPVLYRSQALDSTIKMISDNSGRIRYTATGFASAPGGGFTNTTRIGMCDSRGTKITSGADSAARAVLVTTTGRPRVTRVKSEIDALSGIGPVCPP